MADELDAETKLSIYKLVLNRYKDFISEKESRSISEIRQRVSPYNDFVRRLRDSFTSDMAPYDHRSQFMAAAERAMDYVRRIRTCEFAFTFWMDFPEIERLRIATAMDKAILLAALLRSLESEDARVLVTRRGRPLVRFSWSGTPYMFIPESGSLLVGDDASKLVSDDPVSYCFSDLVYENYEET
ncbi:MAG: hypothetical protein AB1529_01895 [Candidatus Micrarchaeota archaeon]